MSENEKKYRCWWHDKDEKYPKLYVEGSLLTLKQAEDLIAVWQTYAIVKAVGIVEVYK